MEKLPSPNIKANKEPLLLEGWVAKADLSKELGVDGTTVEKRAKKISRSYPDWIKSLKHTKTHREVPHYSLELANLIRDSVKKEILLVEFAPPGWLNEKEIRQLLGVGHTFSAGRKKKFEATEPGWFKNYRDAQNKTHIYCSPEFINSIKEEVQGREKAPEGWVTNGALARKIGFGGKTVKKIAEKLKEVRPSEFKMYMDQVGKLALHYSPRVCSDIEAELSKDNTPSGWLISQEVAVLLKRTNKTIARETEHFRVEHPDWFRMYRTQEKGQMREHYSPELISVLKKQFQGFEKAPDGWLTMKTLLERLGHSSQKKVDMVLEAFRNSRPECFKEYLDSRNAVRLHYSPELIEIIESTLKERRTKKEEVGRTNETIEQKPDVEGFFKDVSEDKTIEAQEFKTLLSIFGSSHLFDILYKYRPEFSGLPADHVKGTLAKYLGDFLILRTNFKIEDLDIALPHLSNASLQESLFEVIKESCLRNYHAKKLEDKAADDREVIAAYIGSIRERSSQMQSAELESVIARVENYYDSLLNDFKKPDNIVDVLREGRTFPDLNQTLNIKEISEKKKMLIGDEMGMGKSASAILSKEYLGSKLALIVVPSNVIGTWENYLSDKVAENGKQIGYFKRGMTPRTLVVDNQESLSEIDGSQFDYIVISQEKMNAQYAELLKAVSYDMLILDEAHKFKNLEGGKRPQYIIELAEAISGEKHLILLSGTPIPNKIKDVATILRLLYPERFKDIKDAELVESVIQGDIIDIRNLLVPRMQMKALRESIKMPELREETDITQLSPEEKDIYEVLLEDDELTADQKIRAFRKFVMNPASLEITPNIEGSKIRDVSAKLNQVFTEKNKVVLFVNGYVEGMIRGENTILEKLNLPSDVTVRVIEGNVSKEERDAIQAEFHNSQGKILLAVSGQTADVGVDFSAAEYMQFYNDPWTLYDKKQQTARGYRPGLENDLTVGTSVVAGTIEEGIDEYIHLKYDAVQKVLKGVPITDIEKNILRTAEKQKTPDIEGSPSIAKEWLNSSQNRLHRFFGMTKEIGEKNFKKFLLEHGEEYAESYLDMGSLGFQANTARIAGTLISKFVAEQKLDPEQLRILDVASGPEMLKKHIVDVYKNRVYSMDINPQHFQGEGDKRVIGSFSKLPVTGRSMDYLNLSLALHYSSLKPRQRDYERIKVLAEINRVLKNKGRAVINLLYSVRLKDEDKFKELAKSLGFKTVEEYTGDISSGPNYRSHVIVLEKEADIDANIDDLIKTIPAEQIDAAKLKDTGVSSLKNSRKCVRDFSLNGQDLEINFNSEDQEILREQESIIEEGEMLKGTYGSIKSIPSEEIISRSFLRINNGKSYRLLKKSGLLESFVDVR